MKQLLMMRPIDFSAIAASSGGATVTNLLTPDPKEAWTTPNTATPHVEGQFATARTIDTIHLGFTDLPHGTTINFYTYSAVGPLAGSTLVGGFTVDNPTGDTRPRHAFAQAAAPIANVLAAGATITQPGARVATIGVLSAGLALQPYWGHEYGAGRFVVDTGNKERLFGGGFGISRGARAGGYSWTFGELSDAEVEALYSLALDAGETGSVLVIENPDTAEAGLNERIHWSMISRIESYERFAPGATRWAFRVEDWA